MEIETQEMASVKTEVLLLLVKALSALRRV